MGLTNEERQEKLNAIVAVCLNSEEGTRLLERGLAEGGMQLFRTVAPGAFPVRQESEGKVRTGIILDVETTGLDPKKDEVIELAMQGFSYDDKGILALNESYVAFNEPKAEIPPEITALTGIEPEMVQGCRIDHDAVLGMLVGVDIVVAHHAAFDRPFVEENIPGCGFDRVNWACSLVEIDWPARGMTGRSMEVLAANMKLAYGAHRALDDCVATAFVLAGDGMGRSPLVEMLDNARSRGLVLVAKDSPFEKKDLLRNAGWRWSPEGDATGGHKAWWKEVPATEAAMSLEAAFLRDEVYGSDVTVPAFRVEAINRHSRRLGTQEAFKTARLDIGRAVETGVGTERSSPAP